MLRNLGPATAFALVLVLATGCSDDEEPSGSPDPSPSASESAPAPTDPPSSETSTPSPSIEPATGPELRVERFSIKIPQGWKITKEGDPFSAQAYDSFATIFIGELPDLGQGEVDLAEAAKIRLRNGSYLRKPEILDPVTYHDQEWYHIAGRSNEFDWSEDFGTIMDELDLGVYMSFPVDTPAAERTAIADSVMVTATLD